jgi:diguanylate cyclase (GGDEF)-like protein
MPRPPDHDRTDRDDERDTTQRTELSAGPRRAGLHSACVVVIHGEGLGKRVDVDEKPIIVGRSQECDLHIPHPSVSRQHCSIWRDAEGYRVRDLGSTNRTRVNEQRIDGAMLADGDHITIGETILKFISHASVEARYHEEVYQLATHDALTELCNRRHFLELLDKEIARAERHGRTLALAIVDVDHFKRVNDEHGHIAGDGVLKQIAEVLRTHVRGEDVAARIGGEEFAVLLPEESPAAARAFAERLREAIAATPFAPGGEARRMTVSIGLAGLSAARTSRTALMRAADEALYAAKDGGRNLVCAAE